VQASGFIAQDGSVAVFAGEWVVVVAEIVASGAGDFAHTGDVIVVVFAADGDPGDAVGEGALDGGVAAEGGGENGFADAAQAGHSGDGDVAIDGLGEDEIAEIVEGALAGDVVLRKVGDGVVTERAGGGLRFGYGFGG
jgi:hypothetical protein